MSRYKTWSEIEKRCVAMSRDVVTFPKSGRWSTFVCYRKTKGAYLEAFAICQMKREGQDPYTDLWRVFRKASRTLRTFELPQYIKAHDVSVVASRDWREEMEANDLDTPPGVGVTVGYSIECLVCGKNHAPPICSADELQPWDDLDANGRQTV